MLIWDSFNVGNNFLEVEVLGIQTVFMLSFTAHFCKGGVIATFTVALDQVTEKTTVLTTQQVLILVSFELKDLKYI